MPPASNGDILKYNLTWDDNVIILDHDVLDHNISELVPDQMYNINLKAVSRVGAGKEYKRSVRTDQFCKYCHVEPFSERIRLNRYVCFMS